MDAPTSLRSLQDIRHAFYINLESRPDRRAHVETQLRNIGLPTFQRFNAIPMKNGAIGCTLSHLRLVELAKANQWDHILIVEDDILFTNPTVFVTQTNAFLKKHNDFDVLLLAGNNIPPHTVIDDTCVQVKSCQTTTGYLVKRHYYDTLIQNYRAGMTLLLNHPANHFYFAIDKYWFHLQAADKWFLITPLTVSQVENYSDIEHRTTNYTRAMLDLDKPWLALTSRL